MPASRSGRSRHDRVPGLAAWVFAAALAATSAFAQRPPDASTWVWRDTASGRLLYRTTPAGDRIPDFSVAGYMGGRQPLPDVETAIPADRRIAVEPPARGDAGQAIQAAIDRLSALAPGPGGFRGLVQLAPGTYEIEDQIRIETSGIVLRGTPTTRLRGTGVKKRSLIAVGASKGDLEEIADTRSEVIDAYVPVGAAALRVRDPGRFRAGAEVVVFRPSTPAWIGAIGMDRLPARRDGGRVVQWAPGPVFDQKIERTIERIEGDRLFLNAPLTNSLDPVHGPSYVYRYRFPARIERVGLIELHGEAAYNPAVKDELGRDSDEQHVWTFIELARVRNAWVERVSGRHFGFATVNLRRSASQVTVRNAASHAPVSKVMGQRRYAFNNEGQLNLMQDLYSESGRHDFANNIPSRGPNVFLRARAVDVYSEVGPHQRWSTGTLWDLVQVSGSTATLAARNAGYRGTGHGHSGANMVFWNSSAPEINVENPPTAQNWVIGTSGKFVDRRDFLNTGPAYVDRLGAPAALGDPARNPEHSLFVAQRLDRARLSSQAAARRVYPAGDYRAAGAGETPRLTLSLDRDPSESAGSAVIRFAARRTGPGTPTIAVSGEPLAVSMVAMDEMAGVVTGTAVLPAAAAQALDQRGAVEIRSERGFPLLWAEIEVDFHPATARVPARREPAKVP